VPPLSKLAKVGQQQLPSCWTAALYAAPINSKAGSTTLLSMQQLSRGQTNWAALNQKKKILHTRYSPKMAVVIHVTFQQQLMHVNGSTKDSNMEWKSWSCWTAAHRHLHTTAPAAPARDSGPHPHFTTRQALLGQKSSIGCSIPQVGSKDKKREKGRTCFKKKKE
jgi:hypothetical protein